MCVTGDFFSDAAAADEEKHGDESDKGQETRGDDLSLSVEASAATMSMRQQKAAVLSLALTCTQVTLALPVAST